MPVRRRTFRHVAHPSRAAIPEQLELHQAVREQVGRVAIQQRLQHGRGHDVLAGPRRQQRLEHRALAFVVAIDRRLGGAQELGQPGREARASRAVQHPAPHQHRKREARIGLAGDLQVTHGGKTPAHVAVDSRVTGRSGSLAAGAE